MLYVLRGQDAIVRPQAIGRKWKTFQGDWRKLFEVKCNCCEGDWVTAFGGNWVKVSEEDWGTVFGGDSDVWVSNPVTQRLTVISEDASVLKKIIRLFSAEAAALSMSRLKTASTENREANLWDSLLFKNQYNILLKLICKPE